MKIIRVYIAVLLSLICNHNFTQGWILKNTASSGGLTIETYYHEQYNGGFHLEATIVSDHFVNKSLIDRHKIVYAALGDLMKHEIHAFSMKTLTVEEWESL